MSKENQNEQIVISVHKARWGIALGLVAGLCVFLTGYFWGRWHGMREMTTILNEATFADTIFAHLVSWQDTKADDAAYEQVSIGTYASAAEAEQEAQKLAQIYGCMARAESTEQGEYAVVTVPLPGAQAHALIDQLRMNGTLSHITTQSIG